MRQVCTRASCPRLFLVVAALSVITLAASSPIHSARVATGAFGGMGAAPQSTTPVTETATATGGNVRAELYYVKVVESSGFTTYVDLRLTISRDGHVVESSGPPHSGSIDGLWPGYGWKKNTKSVHVADLDGDHAPEVEVDLYTGGAHCCRMLWAYRWNGTMYVSQAMQTGSSGYSQRDLNHDGRPEWVTADPRFEYLFTSFAGSGVPLRIYDYRGGNFLTVTSRYPALVRKDAAQWWHFDQRQRSGPSHDSRGLLAAWAADKYMLGAGAKVWPALNAALRLGHLRGPTGGSPSGRDWPTGRAYISMLRQKLREFGYLR
jgi:hypothetical protein